jgi:hypothetical protein
MSVHLRATRDMQPTPMTYYEEEQNRSPQSRPRVSQVRRPRVVIPTQRHHLLHALADGYAKSGAAMRKSRIPMLPLIRGVGVQGVGNLSK